MTRTPRLMLAFALLVLATALPAGAQSSALPFITDVRVDVPNETLTINGLNFGDSVPNVSLALTPLAVLPGATPNAVQAVLPNLDPGTYLLVVERTDMLGAGLFYLTAGAVGPAGPVGPSGGDGASGVLMSESSAGGPAYGTGDSGGLTTTVNAGTETAANTLLGLNAGAALTTGVANTFIGVAAGAANTVNENTGIGHNALNKNTSGQYNTAEGAFAMFENLTGQFNTANGYNSLAANAAG